MRWFEKIANKLEWLAIPNLTLILVAGSGTFFLLGSFHREILDLLPLVPAKVAQGEIWRVATFLFYPLDMHPVFAFFTYYFFYILGSSLEAEWGEARYTLYVLIACVSTAFFAFIAPSSEFKNGYIFGSLFLAFAFLYPDFQVYLFFVIPVKVKYLSAVVWLSYIYLFVTSEWGTRVSIVISLVNFLLFFGGAIWDRVRGGKRSMELKARQIKQESIPFHICDVCKITEKKDPKMEFRVCISCKGLEYCRVHLNDHVHTLGSLPESQNTGLIPELPIARR